MLSELTPEAAKVLQIRTLVPLAKANYAINPEALPAKRRGVLAGYRDFAEKKGIPWRENFEILESRGASVWETERAKTRRVVKIPEYYQSCYEGTIHSYEKGNGEWMAAFDAPSAYLLVHLHHYTDKTPQAAFDALHEELDLLAIKHLLADTGRPIRCVDVGCGVGTSTFSTVKCLEQAGRSGSVLGVDLSDYFIAVAQHVQGVRQCERSGSVGLSFMHGDGLDLASCGVADASVDLVVLSEVIHECPEKVAEAMFREISRVLAPGGVLGFLDLNPAQILKENAVGNIVDRIATRNEPYFDEYLQLDVANAMRAAGLDVLEETWPNHGKYPSSESCSLRILVGRKPVVLTLSDWTGKWSIHRREEWTSWLSFLNIPEDKHEAAAKADDFHEYKVAETSFFMDHQIPAQELHLRFTGFFDGEWQASPYPKPTAAFFDQDSEIKEGEWRWKNKWVNFPTCFDTVLPDFAGNGKTVRLRREITGVDEMKLTVHVFNGGDAVGEPVVGPCFAYSRRTSREPPLNVAAELKERFATGISKSIEWRQKAIDQVASLVLDNVEAWSAAQAADHVTPSSFHGASMMTQGAVGFYKASLEKWASPKSKTETLPPFMQTEGDWEVLPEPKGVGLVIAPWNAPVLLCALPLLGMLAAGNLCVLKPSEAAPHVSRLLARLVPKYFPDRSVVVAEGGPDLVGELMNTPVDHVLFTGGGGVARKILDLAAKHLTPVSLELGGKNPCFVDNAEPEQLALYVAEIVGTKSYFGGQFCQCHDYCLVQEDVFDAFVNAVEAKIESLGESRNCRLINAGHAKRVKAMLAACDAACARPKLPSGALITDDDCVPITALIEPPLDGAVMREEIFGPLLPILKVKSVEEAAAFVARRPKPLVAYCYSPDPTAAQCFRDTTSSGNLAVNCGPQRMQSNFNVGFGGVGESGYGHSIWGEAAFNDYSHHKTVFHGKKFGGSIWGAAPPPSR
eukprot:TRINITY_DN62959_c0_g1_i1.p1 TRINITY_DN62959_c0_g1~~TRINITY_DN62959_c0_g1_i1.p1  ORF type:complete len:1059 (-),score=177.93 TRINITY_DN62959_c0_g1_i1:114-3011(-)